MDELRIRSLKLLADPHKLKDPKKRLIPYDRFKHEIESRFNYTIDDRLYQRILTTIRTELIINSVVRDIIDQAILSHSP